MEPLTFIIGGIILFGIVGLANDSSDSNLYLFRDSDSRVYKIKFYKNENGSYRAFVIESPWSLNSMNQYNQHQRHLNKNMEICMSSSNIYSLDDAKKRVLLWCNGFSYLMEHGYDAVKKALPEW